MLRTTPTIGNRIERMTRALEVEVLLADNTVSELLNPLNDYLFV